MLCKHRLTTCTACGVKLLMVYCACVVACENHAASAYIHSLSKMYFRVMLLVPMIINLLSSNHAAKAIIACLSFNGLLQSGQD